MTGARAYLLVMAPLLVVMTAAVWRPRWWQLLLLGAGPALTAAASAEVPGVDALGWLSGIGVALATLVVAPVLPWRRGWARGAVPATVLAVCAVLVVAAEGEAAVGFYLGLPVLLAVGALLVEAERRWRARRGASPSSG